MKLNLRQKLLLPTALIILVCLSASGLVSYRSARNALQTALRGQMNLSATGIAGPTGATATKPVGLTYIGLSAPDGTWARRFVWQGDREHNRRETVDAALRLMLDYLDGKLA